MVIFKGVRLIFYTGYCTMDEAIRRANRKTMGHFVDILLAKRYDEEDMIILRENDFILK